MSCLRREQRYYAILQKCPPRPREVSCCVRVSMTSQRRSWGGEMGRKHTQAICWVVWLVLSGL